MSATDDLMAAALELVTEQGPAGFTLREAARRAGVSHATPGYLFGDRRGLLTQVAVGGIRRFTAAMETACRNGDTPIDRLSAIGNAYVAFARSEPHIFRLIFSYEHVDSSDAELIDARMASQGPLRRAMAEIYGTDEVTPEILERIQLARATVHGIARLTLDGPFSGTPRSERELAASVIAALMPALLAPLARTASESSKRPS